MVARWTVYAGQRRGARWPDPGIGDLIPSIVFQDGLTSDVDLARRGQDAWTRSVLREGDRLDGFFLQASESGEQKWMSHYFYDRSQISQGQLEIAVLPQ